MLPLLDCMHSTSQGAGCRVQGQGCRGLGWTGVVSHIGRKAGSLVFDRIIICSLVFPGWDEGHLPSCVLGGSLTSGNHYARDIRPYLCCVIVTWALGLPGIQASMGGGGLNCFLSTARGESRRELLSDFLFSFWMIVPSSTHPQLHVVSLFWSLTAPLGPLMASESGHTAHLCSPFP